MLKQTLYEAMYAAAKVLQQYFNNEFKITNKQGVNNLVTEADHASERIIIEIIQRQFPEHYILSEESGAIVMDSNYKWIIDPIDGTVNFANGIPLCCISIAIEKDGQMIMGAVYNPFMNEFFFAEKGKGSTLNDKTIKVSNQPELSKSCIVTGFPYTYLDMEFGPLHVFEQFIRAGVPVRRLGSAAIDLCWVASGRFDGFYEHKLEAWDSAAGYLVVEEAGGKVTDMTGNPYSPYKHGILASNGVLHSEFIDAVNGRWKPNIITY